LKTAGQPIQIGLVERIDSVERLGPNRTLAGVLSPGHQMMTAAKARPD
jgi:hypothetical protein